jgi:hypothetical protein
VIEVIPHIVAVVMQCSVLLEDRSRWSLGKCIQFKHVRYKALVAVSLEKTLGSVTLSCIKPCHTFTLALSVCLSVCNLHVLCEFSFSQILQLCLFTTPST